MNRTGFQLGWSLFMRKWWMQLIITLQLAVTLILINVLACVVYEAFGTQRLFRDFDKENTSFFMPLDTVAVKERLPELKNSVCEPVVHRRMNDENGREFQLMLYGEQTAIGLGVPLKGAEEGCVPCAASAPYRRGERFNIQYNGRSVTLQVVKRLRNADYYLSFPVTSNALSFEEACEKIATHEGAVVLVCNTQLPVSSSSTSRNNLVVFHTDDSEADKVCLREAGWLVSLKDSQISSREELTTYLSAFLPIGIATLSSGLVSLIGLLLLHLLRQMRTLVVFHICGMSRQQMGYIGRAYGLMLAAGAFAAALLGWFTIAADIHREMSLSWLNGVMTLVLLLLPVLAADGAPRCLIPRENPFTALSETEALI